MWILVSAIVTASLLGSMHCVGMCGPLAIWASGAGDRVSTAQMSLATALYHVGRLLTYALAGLLAGAAGQLIDVGGQTLGMQLVAARIVGGLMIVIGSLKLIQLVRQKQFRHRSQLGSSGGMTPQPNLVTRLLLRMRPLVFRLPVPARGLATGLLTAFLPCGWLYLFALVAAGTGSMGMGSVVMTAFWIGTVPALVGLVSGTQALALRFRRIIPVGAAVLLIIGGGYTASGRGFASLHSLSDIRLSGSTAFAKSASVKGANAQGANVKSAGEVVGSGAFSRGQDAAGDGYRAEIVAAGLSKLVETPLPCCVAREAAFQAANVEPQEPHAP